MISTASTDESHRVSDEKLQSLVDQKLLCTCTALDLTFQVNHHMSKDVKKLLYEFYFKLFQSFKFKQHLGLSFSANFEIVSMKRDDKEKYCLGSIGVQILTIDDIGLMIMQDR